MYYVLWILRISVSWKWEKYWHFLWYAPVSDLWCGQAWCSSSARTRRTSAQLQLTPSWCSAFLVLAMNYIHLVLERIMTPWHISRLLAVVKDGTAHNASIYPPLKAIWSHIFYPAVIRHIQKSPSGVNTATEATEPSKAFRSIFPPTIGQSETQNTKPYQNRWEWNPSLILASTLRVKILRIL